MDNGSRVAQVLVRQEGMSLNQVSSTQGQILYATEAHLHPLQ